MQLTLTGYKLTLLHLPGVEVGIQRGQLLGINVEVNDDDDDGGLRDAKYTWIGKPNIDHGFSRVCLVCRKYPDDQIEKFQQSGSN